MEYDKINIKTQLNKTQLHKLLEEQYKIFNNKHSISESLPDPLGVAREFSSDKVALFCALFAYGNVRAILKFLKSSPLTKLQNNKIDKNQQYKVYRFQTANDVEIFIKALCKIDNLHDIFYKAYKKDSTLSGIKAMQEAIYKNISIQSDGLKFLIGNTDSSSPLKRWNMFLRWLVRNDNVDLGRWSDVKKSDLILPLDVHTFKISQKLGILKRKTYDIKAALEATNTLREFDSNDPVKYDFALYRIGQLGLLES